MFEIKLEKNKKYKFCSCGVSKTLPFCDNKHRQLNSINNFEFKSIKITPKENITLSLESKKWLLKDE